MWYNKTYDNTTAEVKRMFVKAENRGSNVATTILQELESWSRELGYEAAVLQTSDKHPEAISFYKKSGYVLTECYGVYKDIDGSICFSKDL